jgi:hypothetical protein
MEERPAPGQIVILNGRACFAYPPSASNQLSVLKRLERIA